MVVVILGWGPAVHRGALGVVHVGVVKNSLGVPLYQVLRFVVLAVVATVLNVVGVTGGLGGAVMV